MRPTFDYAAAIPWVKHDELESAARSLAVDDERAAYDHVRQHREAQLLDDEDARSSLQEIFRDAGIDLVSITTPGALSSPMWATKLTTWVALFDSIPWLRKVLTPDDALTCTDGTVGVILNTQNLGFAIGRDVAEVDRMFNAGYRIFQLTYNDQNLLGAGCYARRDAGLSHRGVETIERINQLGGIVDLSHCGRATTLDAVSLAERPVAYTHTACTAVYDHPRGKSDEELEAIAAADGYVGIVLVPWFLTDDVTDPDLSVFVDHVVHAASIVGPERIGIGSDFINADVRAPSPYLKVARDRASSELRFPAGYGEGYGQGFGELRTYSDFGRVIESLAERFSTREVEQLRGGSFMAFWERHAAAGANR